MAAELAHASLWAVTMATLLALLPVTTASSSATSSCARALVAARCDGRSDTTEALQAALVACAKAGEPVTLPIGRTCLSYPLSLPSNTELQLPVGTTLKAMGPVNRWPNCSWVALSFDSPANDCRPNATGEAGMPFLSAPPGTRNLTIRGPGTIDGSGNLWWTKQLTQALPSTTVRRRIGSGHCTSCPLRRPYLLHLPSAFGVRLLEFSLCVYCTLH